MGETKKEEGVQPLTSLAPESAQVKVPPENPKDSQETPSQGEAGEGRGGSDPEGKGEVGRSAHPKRNTNGKRTD